MSGRVEAPGRILVTGGTGLLGRGIVGGLLHEGYPVRVFARNQSDTQSFERMGVEISRGDVADRGSLEAAFEGVEAVVHAAAGTSGSRTEGERSTLLGTRNVLELCSAHQVRKLVYISSCSVYGTTGLKRDSLIGEEAALERFPERRGDYTLFKVRAETEVLRALGKGGFSTVVLRPGTVYAEGAPLFTPMMGVALSDRVFVVIGDGDFVLPLVHRDNLVDAVIRSLRGSEADNQVFNVVDGERVTKKRYMNDLIRRLHPKALVLYCPFWFVSAATWLQELTCRILRVQPPLTRYRLAASQARVRYDSSRIVSVLGWRSRTSFGDGAAAIVRRSGSAGS